MRLAAQAKGGFYPTPERVVDLLAELIHIPTGYGYHYRNRETLCILDPCCGAGEALAQLAERLDRPDALPIETYGVELHRERAQEAEERLDRALASDLFATSIANGAVGLLLLNRPYDYDLEDKRTEHAFLTQTTRYFSDDQRMRIMFDILSHAAQRVQIVVSTCREQLFGGLGAHEVQLTSVGSESLRSA